MESYKGFLQKGDPPWFTYHGSALSTWFKVYLEGQGGISKYGLKMGIAGGCYCLGCRVLSNIASIQSHLAKHIVGLCQSVLFSETLFTAACFTLGYK